MESGRVALSTMLDANRRQGQPVNVPLRQPTLMPLHCASWAASRGTIYPSGKSALQLDSQDGLDI